MGGGRDLFLICKSVMKVILVCMQRDSMYFLKGGGGGDILTYSRCRRWPSVEMTLISVSTVWGSVVRTTEMQKQKEADWQREE